MTIRSVRDVIMRGFRTWALPRLSELPASTWDDAIHKAQSIDFDAIERGAMVAGVVFVAYALRIEGGTVPAISLPIIYLMQLMESVPLLILLVGPVYLRRARRGLDRVIADRRNPASQDDESDDR